MPGSGARNGGEPREQGHLVAPAGPAAEPPSGKTDLLLRFFDSQFFDEWIALTYLFKSTSAGVQDYLCNRLYSLSEAGIERYLLQLGQLVLTRPHTSLERVLIDLCARSLRLAVKVYWLVLAHTQDHPNDKYAAEFRDACERAAVEGYWEPPFKDAKLLPLSPMRSNMFSPPMSPTGSASGAFSPRPRRRRNSADGYLAEAAGRCLSPVEARSPTRPRSPDFAAGRPLSPDTLSRGMSSQVMGLEGLMYGSPTYVRQSSRRSDNDPLSPAERVRVARLRQELGNGEGVTGLLTASLRDSESGGDGLVEPPELLSPPSSPRQRYHTFGATLDFIEALCLASSGLTAFAHEDRQWALVRALQDISAAVEGASRQGIAIWSPLGTTDQRIVRLSARDSKLLASREKAPFLLYVEVLQPDQPEADKPAGSEPPGAAALKGSLAAKADADSNASDAAILGMPASAPANPETEAAADAGAAAIQDTDRTASAPVHMRTISAAEEAGGSGADPFVHLQLPQPQPRGGHQRSASTGSSLADLAGDTWPSGAQSRRSLSFADSHAPPPPHPADSRRQRQRRVPTAVPEAELAEPDAAPDAAAPSGNSRQQPEASPAQAAPESRASSQRLPNDEHADGQRESSAPDAAAECLEPVVSIGSPHQQHRDIFQGLSLDSQQQQHAPVQHQQQQQLHPQQQPQRVSSQRALAAQGQPPRRHLSTDSFTGGLTAAMEGLRGNAPLVRLQLTVHNDAPAQLSTPSTPGSGSGSSSGASSYATFRRYSDGDTVSPAGSPAASPAALSGMRAASVGSPLPEPPASDQHPPNSGWLCKLGLCRQCSARLAVIREAEAAAASAPRVEVRLKVHGGLDLRLQTPPAGKGHMRVPSAEALSKMAAKHRRPVPLLSPRGAQQAAAAAVAATASSAAGTDGAVPSPFAAAADVAGTLPAAAPAAVIHGAAAAGASAAGAGSQPSVGRGNHARDGSAGHLMAPAVPYGDSRGGVPAGKLPPPSPGPAATVEAALLASAQRGPNAAAERRRSDSVVSAAEEVKSSRQAALSEAELEKRRKAAEAIYGERFQDKAERVRQRSPYGRRPGWALRPVMVKSGDDCRQEALAMQLISAFDTIFQEERLPLWLRPYEVLVTSARTALIEFVPNTASIHAIKAKSPPRTSLRDHYVVRFGPVGGPKWAAAQRAFVESMAAYSLVSHLLQIKDRHNGNILVDEEGHLVHIDFGFMLSNSPGGVNFESAPFKLTRELLQVMDSDSDGRASELFDYFKVLCIRGFLAARKHADRILLLVEMLASSGFPCFKAGPKTVYALRRRFALQATEPQCVEMVLQMISDSLDAWRTRQYDYYQRILNGIM